MAASDIPYNPLAGHNRLIILEESEVLRMKGISGMLLSAFMVLFFFGCPAPGQYGRLGAAGPDMTIEKLVKHWEEYHVSYAGVNRTQPTALLFDPKGDDLVITLHQYWASVDTEAELSEVIRWLQPSGGRVALYKILGPGQQVFGYLIYIGLAARNQGRG